MDFAVLLDHRIKIKENEKRDKYLYFARELKKAKMKVAMITIVFSALGTIHKGSVKGQEELKIGGRAETIQTIALLKSARILRRVLET